jgi:hypothetical protein
MYLIAALLKRNKLRILTRHPFQWALHRSENAVTVLPRISLPYFVRHRVQISALDTSGIGHTSIAGPNVVWICCPEDGCLGVRLGCRISIDDFVDNVLHPQQSRGVRSELPLHMQLPRETTLLTRQRTILLSRDEVYLCRP